MKQTLVTAYTFTAVAKTIDLSSIVSFDIKRLYAIINITANQVIYAVGIPAYGLASHTGALLTLAFDTTSMADADELAIIYDTINTDVANSFVTKVSDGVNTQAVKAASTAADVADPSAVVALSPNSPLPTGSNSIGSISNISGIISLPTGAATEATLSAFKSANHVDLVQIDTDLLSFKSANHADLLQIDTDLLAFKSANHTDLLQIDTDLLAFKTANHIDLTGGLQKAQTVDGSGNIQPVGDVAARGMFVKPTDGTNSQSYTASGEAKVLVTPLTNSSIVKAQLQDNAGTAITLGQKVMASSVPVAIASDQSAIPVSQSGTWNITNISGTISLPTGASTEATLSALSAKFNSLGQKTMANSAPVVISSDQSAIPVTQSGTWTVQQGTPPWSVGGNVASGVSDSGNPVKVGGVFNSAFPTLTNGQRGDIQLDSSARQVIAPLTNSSIVKAQLQDNAGTAITLGQKAMASSVPVVISSDQSAVPVSQSGTWNITNISGTISLPTGAATETTLSALNAKFNSLGQKTMANSAPVVISSDQSAIPASQSGTWTVQQGSTPTAVANAWPIKLTDGTNTTAVKAASTAAAAADPSAVVALSPNSPLPAGTNTLGVVSTKIALTSSSPTAASVGVASAQAVASNANRKGLVLINTSSKTISFGIGATAVLNSGITLLPGGVWVMDEYTFTTGAINAIAGAAASNLAIQEFTT